MKCQGEGSPGGKPQKQDRKKAMSEQIAGEKNHAGGSWEMELSGEVKLDDCQP